MGYITSHVKYSIVEENFSPLEIDNSRRKWSKIEKPRYGTAYNDETVNQYQRENNGAAVAVDASTAQ